MFLLTISFGSKDSFWYQCCFCVYFNQYCFSWSLLFISFFDENIFTDEVSTFVWIKNSTSFAKDNFTWKQFYVGSYFFLALGRWYFTIFWLWLLKSPSQYNYQFFVYTLLFLVALRSSPCLCCSAVLGFNQGADFFLFFLYIFF